MPFQSKRNLFSRVEFATEEQRDLYDWMYEFSLDHETPMGQMAWGMAMFVAGSHPDWTFWEVVREVRKMNISIAEEKIGIMVCRDADQPQKPGATKGYFCAICKKEVWITPAGLQHVSHLYVLCNGCGVTMYAKLREQGAALDERLSPTALASLVEFVKKGSMP